MRDVSWETDWTVGGDESDTLLAYPLQLVADRERVYVVDPGFSRVLALHTRDGTVAWTFGTPGSGPREFATPRAIALDAAGNLLVSDQKNMRVTVVDTAGRWVRDIPVHSVSGLHSMCPLHDGTLLVMSYDPERPVIRVSPNGEVLGRGTLPWQQLAKAPLRFQQGIFAPTVDRRSCIFALQANSGLAQYNGTGFDTPTPYVEDHPLVHAADYRHGERNAYRSAVSVTADSATVVVGFRGSTRNAGRLLDVYDATTRQYSSSMLLPKAIIWMTRVDDTYYVITGRNRLPVIAALRPSGAP
jgi:outer membrane protein assembly factor BamB